MARSSRLVGAVLPVTVQLLQASGSIYGYAIVNGAPVLADVNARTVF
ncbi:MAG: hypothetical protein GY798_22745 [Hyphomicrobiales bacterium]|nr:hypothetical protein [Hyphomicrobiales bacterium]